MRILIRGIILAAVLAVTATAYLASYRYFRSEELVDAQARLSLYRSTVEAELERFAHLPFVMARDPFVIRTAQGTGTGALNDRLASFADRAGIDAIYLMNPQGLTKASSNAGQPGSFIGQNYGFRPYFKAAMAGRQGEFYGIGATTGIPGYFFAEPVRGATGDALGVVAIKIDLSGLQESWRRSGERVILANADGVVLLSSEPAWRYRTLQPLSEDQRKRIEAARQFTGQSLDVLNWSARDAQTAVIDGRSYLYRTATDLPNDWSLHYFAPDNQAVTRSWLVAGSVLFLAGLVLIAVQVQRAQRMGAALRRSEQEEAQLRLANERLAVEIEDRRTAERRLKRTQSQLERAGRLAALGQLAASVTHELGQPIAAMRNHLAAAELQGGRNGLTDRMQALVDRMEGITRQLKFFARKGRDNFEDVDLRDAAQAVLELMAPDLEEIRVLQDWADAPHVVHGNRLRLEQVLTNLMRNARDAVDGQADPMIDLRMGVADDQIWIEVADNGPGLGGQSLDELREPFATTKESGHGMGLGLTISAGIVDDHDGTMTARERNGGGAAFRATFPKPEDSE